MKKMLTIGVIGVVILASAVGGCSCLVNIVMDSKSCPQYMKLSNFTNDTASARIIWPKGEPWCYNLILAIPMDSSTNWLSRSDVCPSFSGTVSIRDSTDAEVGQYGISQTNAGRCNWLTQHSLDAFIVGWQQTNCLKTSMSPGKEYKITVNIPSRPKDFTSLWLGFVQSGEQFRKEHRTTPRTVP